MAKSVITKVQRIEGTDKVSIFIDNDVNACLSDNARNKFMLYLRSIIRSVEYYAGEEEKKETARLHPRTLSSQKEIIRCKLDIRMIGYKDEDYILIKFEFAPLSVRSISTCIKDVYLSVDEAKKLLKDLNI